MTKTVCDRCGVDVAGSPASLQAAIPIADPATKPKLVTADPFLATFTLGLVSTTPGQTSDLCPSCYGSALVELAIGQLAGQLNAKQVAHLQGRIGTLAPVVVAA